MKLLSGRVLFDLVLLAAATWGVTQARGLPPAFGPGQIGPGDFPTAVLMMALIALIGVLAQDLRSLRTDRQPSATEGSRIGGPEVLGVLTTVLLLAGYIALLERLGFLVSTVLFLFLSVIACTWFLSRPTNTRAWRNLLMSAAILAIAGAGLSFVVFTYGFGLIFP